MNTMLRSLSGVVLVNVDDLATKVNQASEMLGAIAHATRLSILWILCESDKSVGELERTLALRQPTVSQHLARLRRAGLVRTRREGKLIYYSLAGPHVRIVVTTVHDVFRDEPEQDQQQAAPSNSLT